METARDVTSNVASQVDNAASNAAEKGSEANAGFAGAPRRFQFKRKPWNATPSGISLSISNFTASFTTASAVTSSDSWRNLVLVGSLYGRNYSYQTEANMGFGRGILLWILGVPIPIIILLALFWHN